MFYLLFLNGKKADSKYSTSRKVPFRDTSNISARSLNVSHQALLPAVGLKNYFNAIK